MKVKMEEIISLVSLQLGVKKVTEAHRLVEDLGAESADIANIIASLEEKYDLFISEDKIAKIKTVKDIHTTLTQFTNDHKNS